MEKIILDTNILIEMSKSNMEIIHKITNYNRDTIFITSIIYVEYLNGVFNKETMPQAKKLLQNFKTLHSNVETDNIFIQLFEKYSLSHKPSIPDMLIASSAIYYNAKLFTLNKKDFTFIEGLQLFV
ncbi:MAG: PIN domain-containing protein [Cytophagales bacterium]